MKINKGSFTQAELLTLCADGSWDLWIYDYDQRNALKLEVVQSGPEQGTELVGCTMWLTNAATGALIPYGFFVFLGCF